MKIGILFDDDKCYKRDLRHPELGNPGVGGTQYCFLMLVRYYKEMFKEDEVILYHTADNGNVYWEDVNLTLVRDVSLLPKICSRDGIDVLVINFTRLLMMQKGLDLYKIKTIIWMHNYISKDLLQPLKECDYVRRIVFVSRQQYDRYIDDDIIKKSSYIYNMFNSACEGFVRSNNLAPIVTYTGALVKGKGFHALAREWKWVISKVPDAQLYVIGSGSLYNHKELLGKYGIAAAKYEDEFMKYLTNSSSEILPSVHFMGLMGADKTSIYQKTKVGVINPTAKTETFGLSAVEMEACGIPVVTKKKNGLPDVVLQRKTGFLFHNRLGFRRALIVLLTDNELNQTFSRNSQKYVVNNFSPQKIIVEWNCLFHNIMDGSPATYISPNGNWFNNAKWLRMLNRSVRKVFHWIPSVCEIECKISSILKKVRGKL